jgi:2-polyprenyl-3-methyl-5-hydroxy-6-metoxy-1,4-benzoquinol methylase
MSDVEAASTPLAPENVFGHTHKVLLFREECGRVRRRRRGASLRILDVGCGSGYAVTRFLGAPGDDVLGIDLHQPNVRYAQRAYARPGLRFECRSAESLVGSSGSYDVIVLADILEHLTDPGAVLVSCVRLLRTDGLLLITVPNGFGPFETESALARVPLLGPLLLKLTDYVVAALNKYGPLRGRWTAALAASPPDLPYNLESGHLQFFTRRRLAALSRSAGLRITRVEGLSFLSGPFTNFLLGASQAICMWNVAVAGWLPAFAVSSWFFVCESTVAGASNGV